MSNAHSDVFESDAAATEYLTNIFQASQGNIQDMNLSDLDIDLTQTEENYDADLAAIAGQIWNNDETDAAIGRIRQRLGLAEKNSGEVLTCVWPTFQEDETPRRQRRRKIKVLDTTLRDGIQSRFARLSLDDKIDIARTLAKARVDVIEIAFASGIKSEGIHACAIVESLIGSNSTISIMANCHHHDIDVAASWLISSDPSKKRIHILYNPDTFGFPIDNKSNDAWDKCIRSVVDCIEYARTKCDDIEFSLKRAVSFSQLRLAQLYVAAARAGARTLNIPDSKGLSTPLEYGAIIAFISMSLINTGFHDVAISAHCHNDLGMATGNSIVACEMGADQVECTINGIGDRAGNAALEEIVAILSRRSDHFDLYTDVDISRLGMISRMFSAASGVIIPDNKPIVGSSIDSHLIVSSRDVKRGKKPRSIRLIESIPSQEIDPTIEPTCSRGNLARLIRDHGHSITDDVLDLLYERFRELVAIKKKRDGQLPVVYTSEVLALLTKERGVTGGFPSWEIISMSTLIGTSAPTMTSIKIRTPNGEIVQDAAVGASGPVDAICQAIERATNIKVELTDYRVKSVSRGRDTLCDVQVQLLDNGVFYFGRSISIDVIHASAEACLFALEAIWRKNRNIDVQALIPREATRSDTIPMRPTFQNSHIPHWPISGGSA